MLKKSYPQFHNSKKVVAKVQIKTVTWCLLDNAILFASFIHIITFHKKILENSFKKLQYDTSFTKISPIFQKAIGNFIVQMLLPRILLCGILYKISKVKSSPEKKHQN